MKEKLSPQGFFINFYGRRALRIFPLYYLYTFAVLVICLIVVNTRNYNNIENIERFLAQIPWTLTYTYDFFHATQFYKLTQLCSHFWSLAVEEQFYLIWPALILLINKKQLQQILLIIVAMGPVLRLLIATIQANQVFTFLLPQADLLIYVLPFSHVDAFAIGGYFALYKNSDRTNLPTTGVLFLSIFLGYLAQYSATQHVYLQSLGYRPYMQDQFILGYSIMNFVFAKIIMQIRDGKFFPSLMDNPLLNYLGKTSYGLYVFHHSIIWLVRYTIPSLHNSQVALVSILCTISISSIIYEVYEKRFLELKDKYFSKTLLT